MNEATELIDKYAMQIVDAVKKAAPEVWEAAITACVGAYVAELIIGGLLLLLGVVLLVCGCRWAPKPDSNGRYALDEEDGAAIAGVVCGAIMSILGVVCTVRGVLGINYWVRWDAIENILDLIKP